MPIVDDSDVSDFVLLTLGADDIEDDVNSFGESLEGVVNQFIGCSAGRFVAAITHSFYEGFRSYQIKGGWPFLFQLFDVSVLPAALIRVSCARLSILFIYFFSCHFVWFLFCAHFSGLCFCGTC